MAEGLDNAADVFRAAISPRQTVAEATRERDAATGRFTPTHSRPEPLFAERRVEGDPLTGDTRDGGEDPRLAAIERRIADGRGEEGDARELEQGRRLEQERLDRGENRRRTAGDRGREREADLEAEPDALQREESERSGSQDGERDEADPASEEGDAARQPKQDAESARWALTLDGKAVDDVELDVGGETRRVSLADMIEGYVGHAGVQQRQAELEEAGRQFSEASTRVAGEIGQARQEYLTKLDFVNRILARFPSKEPDWAAEYQADPKAAAQHQQTWKEFKSMADTIVGEMQREQSQTQYQSQEQQRLSAQNEAQYIEWGKQEFQRRTGISDNATLANEYQAMRKVALETYGFTEAEVGRVFDPRMLQVLHDASKYRRETAYKPRPVSHDRGRTLLPGGSRPFNGSGPRKSIDDALRRQAASGTLDDTAAVFERLIR